MKRLLILVALFVGLGVHSQSHMYTVTSDTAENTETIYAVFPVTFENNYKAAIQVVYDEITNGATTVIRLQGSIDGTNYVYIVADSLATGVDANKIWTFETGLPYKYIRAEFEQAGTTTGTITCYCYTKEDEPGHGGYLRTQLIDASSDTVTNSASGQANFVVPLLHDWIYCVQVNFDEITPGATATINLQGSLDGTNYSAIGTTYTATTDTNYLWTDVAGTTYKYLRINNTQTGTTTTRIYGYLYLKPNDQ